ncbi:MAG: response regulator [Gemmatimonadetes bacterium]|nr:response regulator [Gemmatimonadota bacterium]
MDVLVIEDEASMRRAFSKVLEKAGYMVTEVDNGLAALAAIQEAPFRAIVCDLGLPFLKGKTFYENLLTDYPEAAERVLFVTGLAHDPETRKFLEKTGRPFLAKPVELAEFVTAVKHIILHSRPSRRPADRFFSSASTSRDNSNGQGARYADGNGCSGVAGVRRGRGGRGESGFCAKGKSSGAHGPGRSGGIGRSLGRHVYQRHDPEGRPSGHHPDWKR